MLLPSKILDKSPFLFKGEPEALAKLVQRLPSNPNVLEIGTFRGLSAVVMAKARPDVSIVTIDSHVGIHRPDGSSLFSSFNVVLNNLKTAKVEAQVTHIEISSQDYIPDTEFDMLFIDGSHTFPSVSHDFHKFKDYVKSRGLIVFHDYGKLRGVTMFCNNLKYGKVSRYKSLVIIEKP